MNKTTQRYLQAMQQDLIDINQDIEFFQQLKDMYKHDGYDDIIAKLKHRKRELARHITEVIKDRMSAGQILEYQNARKS
jgi:hypothetical protein